MSQIKRIGYFLIGVSFSIVIIAFFLKGRDEKLDFCYLPNCRVLKNIRSKSLSIDPKVQETLNTYKVNRDNLKDMLTYGEVDFSESDTDAKPCKTYIVEVIWKEKDVTLTVKNCLKKAVITDFSIE